MGSLVARFRTNLTAKIVLLVCVSEVLLLAVLGAFYLRGYNRELDSGTAEKMSVPAVLMSQMALSFDVVTDLGALGGIVQEPVVDAFVARRTGDVYFASDPAKLGRPYAEYAVPSGALEVPGGGKLWRSGAHGARHLSLLAPLRSPGGDEIGHLFLKIDAASIDARRRRALRHFVLGSALAVLFTLLISGFWVHRLFVPRIEKTVAVLREVQDGRYSARVGSSGAPDQIGRLMRSVDAMIERINAHTENLRALARAGEDFAVAESRADIQRALAGVLASRFPPSSSGVGRPLAEEAASGKVAAGEIVLVRGEAGDGGPGSARLYYPVVDQPAADEAAWLAVDPGPADQQRDTGTFLRTLGDLLADAVVRVDALARLREAEKEYRDLFDNALEGIFKVSAEGRLVAANPSLVRMLGFASATELMAHFLAGPETLWAHLSERDAFLRRIRNEGEVQDFEALLRRRDGTTLWVALTGRRVGGGHGAPGGIEGSVSDISERKRREAAEVQRRAAEVAQRETSELFEALGRKNSQLEETYRELQHAQAKLVRNEKMAAMGTMAAGVAHDLNNILSGIVGYPDLLLMDLPEGSPLRHDLEVIRESGTRAAAVVSDLLTLARGAAYTVEDCDPNQLVEKYLLSPEHRALAARHPGIRVVTRLAPAVPSTRCSQVHMQKVMMNLVMNAFEAIRTTGEVTISTGARAIAGGEESAAGAAPGDYVVIAVEDNGPGIPSAELGHVFEPFFTKKVLGRSGTGLGLAVVWNTVQEHGGAVVARSDERGAAFTVLLPTADGAIAAAATAGASGEQLRGSGTILVVDDEPHVRDLAARMLTALGYTVDGVSSGEEALAYLRSRPVDLVVLDMLMPPGMNGCETYREIVRIRPGQRAVICSGYSQSGDVVEAQRLGAGRFLRKPFSLTELAAAVKQELESPMPPTAAA